MDKVAKDVIHIPNDILVSRGKDLIKAIVEITYPNFTSKYNDPTYLEERVVLTSKNETMFEISDYMINILDGPSMQYLSSYLICKASFNV